MDERGTPIFCTAVAAENPGFAYRSRLLIVGSKIPQEVASMGGNFVLGLLVKGRGRVRSLRRKIIGHC